MGPAAASTLSNSSGGLFGQGTVNFHFPELRARKGDQLSRLLDTMGPLKAGNHRQTVNAS